MKVELLHVTPLEIVIKAIRKCYDSLDKSDSGLSEEMEWQLGERDKELIKRVIESGHTSTLEHINFTFELEGYSRAVLHELSRHRMSSPSVKSSRYCMKEVVNVFKESCGRNYATYKDDPLTKFLKITGDEEIDRLNVSQLASLAWIVNLEGTKNDVAKYALPEAYLTSSILTLNARSFRNLIELRTSKRALKEFQDLVWMMIGVVPEKYFILFEDLIHV